MKQKTKNSIKEEKSKRIKLKEKFKKIKFNKKWAIISGVIILVVALIVGISVYHFVFSDDAKIKAKEKELTKELEIMGKDFYENYYYDAFGKTDDERKENIKKYESTGVKVDLDNLSRYNSNVNKEKIKSFVNPLTKEKCSINETKVIIYPIKDYGKKDYKIETVLVCGFDK